MTVTPLDAREESIATPPRLGPGPSEAYTALVKRYSPLVLGVCRRMLRDQDAEDAAQAVFILLWSNANRLKEEVSLTGWLHKTARFVCRNAIRARTSRIKHEQRAAEISAMNRVTADPHAWDDIRPLLDEEVNRLPDKLRIPFIMFHLQQHSLAEIAAMVGSSVPTVGTWLQRSRERIAAGLQRKGVSVGVAALAALLSQHTVAEAAASAFLSANAKLAASLAAGSAECSPAVVALVKASTAGAVKKAWLVASGLAALLIAFPLTVYWLLPMLQTRLSPDFPLLQGEWREVVQEQDGSLVNVLPKVEYEGSLVISGRGFHRFQTLSSGQVIEGERGTFVLDDATDPKSIDLHAWMGTAYAIYEIDQDTLTLCVTRNAGQRPTELATAANDERLLTRYQKAR